MIVDFHVHVWQPNYIPASVRRYWAANAGLRHDPPRDPEDIFPRVTVGVSDPEGTGLLAALEANAIDRGVVLAVDYGLEGPGEGVTPIRDVLRSYSSIVRGSGGRLEFIGSVDPRRQDAQDRAVEVLDDLGAKGLKFYPPAWGDPGQESFHPLYELLIERDAPAVFHTAIVAGPFENRFCAPVMLDRVQKRFPELRIVLAHSGYPAWWEEAVAVASAHPRTYLELSLWQLVADRNWSAVSEQIVDAVHRVGADRVIFGSDSMFGARPEKEIASVRKWVDQISSLAEDHRLAAEQVDMILGHNAMRLLNLSD